jgi:hypothetical protein
VVDQGYYDVALLKVDAKAPSIIPILPQSELRIGQKLLTMGLRVNFFRPGSMLRSAQMSRRGSSRKPAQMARSLHRRKMAKAFKRGPPTTN